MGTTLRELESQIQALHESLTYMRDREAEMRNLNGALCLPSTFLPPRLPAFTFLPACPSSCLPACLPACLPDFTSLPACCTRA